jgi:3-oxoacyl-[acyl-carrier protein] reductase
VVAPGIGRTIAAALAAQGDRVTITGRRATLLEEAAASFGAAWVAFDASDPAAVSAALDQLPQTVAVLVNNAGGNTDFDRAARTRTTWLVWRPPGGLTSTPTCCRRS